MGVCSARLGLWIRCLGRMIGTLRLEPVVDASIRCRDDEQAPENRCPATQKKIFRENSKLLTRTVHAFA